MSGILGTRRSSDSRSSNAPTNVPRKHPRTRSKHTHAINASKTCSTPHTNHTTHQGEADRMSGIHEMVTVLTGNRRRQPEYAPLFQCMLCRTLSCFFGRLAVLSDA